jgi:hypothetical protein
VRVLFAIAERLHQPVTVVEGMSLRHVQGWLDYWATPAHAAAADDDDAIDMATLSPTQLRAMFPGR